MLQSLLKQTTDYLSSAEAQPLIESQIVKPLEAYLARRFKNIIWWLQNLVFVFLMQTVVIIWLAAHTIRFGSVRAPHS